MKQRKAAAGRMLTVLCVLLLLGVLCASAMTTWRATAMFLDGDASTELILSRHLHDKGVLISDSWDYSTEVRVLVTQNLLQIPLFSFLTDWHKIRFIATMLWQVIYLLCWGALAHELGCNVRRFCIGGAALLLPFSVAYGRLVLYCAYYCPVMAFCLLETAIFLWSMKRLQREARKDRIIAMAVLFLASLVAGVHGARYMLNITAPVICTSVMLLVMRMAGRKEKLSDLRGRYLLQLLPLLVMVIGSGIGYVFYNRFLMTHFHCDTEYVSQSLQPMTVFGAWDMVLAWMRNFGYCKGVALFSREGVGGVLGAMGAIGSLIAGICWIRDPEASGEKRFASLFCLLSLLIVAVYMGLVSGEADYEYYDRYFLVATVFAVPMLMTPARADRELRVTPRGLLSVCCMAALLISGFNTLTYFNTLGGNIYMTYEGLTYKDQLTVWKLGGSVDFLQREGYDTGLALGATGYWYSPVITEMTDGAIAMGYIGKEGNIRMNDRNFLTDSSQLAQSRFFLMVENQDATGLYYHGGWAEGAEVVYQDSYFTIVTYADPVAKLGHLCVPRP